MFKSTIVDSIKVDLACESFDDDVASIEMPAYEASNEGALISVGIILVLWAVFFKLFSKIFEWLGIGGKKSGGLNLNLTKLEKKIKDE